jgi:hypothetical protein
LPGRGEGIVKILISIKDGKVCSVKATSADGEMTTVMTHYLDTDTVTGEDWTWDNGAVEKALAVLNKPALESMERVTKSPLEVSVGTLLKLFSRDPTRKSLAGTPTYGGKYHD